MKILEDRGVVDVGRRTRHFHSDPFAGQGQGIARCGCSRTSLFLHWRKWIVMLELRQVLEETAAGLAAVRATKEDLDAMSSALDAMQRGGV